MLPITLFLFHLLCAANLPFSWQNCTKESCSDVSSFLVIARDTRSDVDYASIGVVINKDSLSQTFKVKGSNRVGSQLHLLDSTQETYVKFKFLDAELSYDVDISQMLCGINAAFYSSEIPANGISPGHESGARYGGGYCDANYVGGVGCAEFDIQEANANATVYTTHGCDPSTGFAPKGEINCDMSGTAANPYWVDKTFYGYGPSFKVDTSRKFTVVTQFIGSPVLTEVKRIYIQDGKLIEQPNSITKNLEQVSRSFAEGHVLIWSLWAADVDMSWMDCGDNGPCFPEDELSKDLQEKYPNSTVTFSNLRFGELNSTF